MTPLVHSASLESRISALGGENSKAVGDALEIFIEGYLATQPIAQCEETWLVGEVPLQVRNDLVLPHDAKCIDGVYRTKHNSVVPYQVKFRSKRAYLTFTELAGFIGVTDRAEERVIFTNSNELAEDIARRPGLRVVRGIDFDRLEPIELKAIEDWLKERPVQEPKATPKDYQEAALLEISACLAENDRAHVVMACGTGKTLIALWSAERLGARRILVMLPSLSLLRQTLQEWSKHNSWGRDYSYICVCSDPTVKKGSDEIRIDPTEVDFRVDTDPGIVKQFLGSPSQRVRVVFSTYQSSPVISDAMDSIEPFDLCIFDEAHKTTGLKATNFAMALTDREIRIKKRLFFTATPRHYDVNKRDEDGDLKYVSMDDATVYGPRAHTLTFAEAAKAGIICPYKVVVSLINKKQVDDFALRNGLTLVEGDPVGIKWVANELAVEQAIQETNASRVITFHSRVSLAKEFASETSHGINRYLNGFSIFHVNGEQRSSDREDLLHAFRDAPKGLITNARCLTEGIDVPAVDMVAFIDPRQSKIDIAQATGRAMRKPEASNKTTGYVVVPIFIDSDSDDDIEDEVQGTKFEELMAVLNALQEQDQDLVDIIRSLREDRGGGKAFNPRILSEKVRVIGDFVSLARVSESISVRIVDRIGSSWDEMCGRLLVFCKAHGHCRVPYGYETNDGYRLGKWVTKQRTKRLKLDPERRRRLEELPDWSWDARSDQWEEGFSRLSKFSQRESHCRVSQAYKTEDGFRLGQWVGVQRANRDEMDPERRQRLEALPDWSWDARSDQWEEGLCYLKQFSDREGHCRVSAKFKSDDGYPLGGWVRKQRTNREVMDPERSGRLDAIPGWFWDPFYSQWEEGFSYLERFYKREGHCRVPNSYQTEDGYRLGNWANFQRAKRNELRPERRDRLEQLPGWSWNMLTDNWEQGFARLKQYSEREGHCRVPFAHKTEDGYRLGGWVNNQRGNKIKMGSERRQRLEELPGWSWNTRSEDWDDWFSYLKQYSDQEGHCRVPTNYKTGDGYQLGKWVLEQRTQREEMELKRRQRLERLPGWSWNTRTDAWEQGFYRLKEFSQREGHCRVPANFRTGDSYRLGTWVMNQRKRKDELDPVRQQRLEELPGWSWDARFDQWEEGFTRLQQFSEREGHCRVPSSYLTDDGYRLGRWVIKQRENNEKMDADRRRRLGNLVGWSWDPSTDRWEQGFSHLKKFSEREGHCRVPDDYKTEDGYQLGRWLSFQKRQGDRIDADRIRRLEELRGWSWTPLAATQWEMGFSYLSQFSAREGHCRVPNSFVTDDGYRLGQWRQNQRARKDTLDLDRQKRLEELPGWIWKARG